MKKLFLALVVPFSVNAAVMTTATDSLFKISPKCEDPSLLKKTVFLVDYTVDNKTALATNLKSIEANLNTIYNSDQKEYLLNHKFEFAVIDSSGEHSSEWKVQTPKEFGSRFSKLNNALAELNAKIDQSISSIKGDTKKYNSSLLLEQISNYGRNLEACDNLFVLSDFMLVDKEGNNFEKDKFLTPAELELKKGHVALLRIERSGLTLKIIQKVERWWEQALNGGNAFSKYAKTKPELKLRKSNYFVSMTSP